MVVPKPKLEKLNTPMTSSFPPAIMTTSAHSATSTSTPTLLSALPTPRTAELHSISTPISPPLAYTDFLSKAMSLQSPDSVLVLVSRDTRPLQPALALDANETMDTTAQPALALDANETTDTRPQPALALDANETTDTTPPQPALATAPSNTTGMTPPLSTMTIESSERTESDSSSRDEQLPPAPLLTAPSTWTTTVSTRTASNKPSPLLQPPPPAKRSAIKVTITASDRASAVASALASASASPIPSSPHVKVPLSAPPTGPTSFPSLKVPPSPAWSSLDSPMSAVSSLRSPFSAMSFHPVFDWDAALKARFADQKCLKPLPSSRKTSVRHIREVITRTVIYTPRMDPAPRGKRRKID